MEELKDLAIIDPDNYGGLLKFYRTKVSFLEKERLEYLSSINNLKIESKEKHKNEWEIYRLKNQKEEFERKISDLKIKFFQEQSFVINLKNEKNDLLNLLKKEEKKVKELLAHIQPVSEKIILREGKKPKFHYKFIKTSSDLNSIQKLKDKYIHKDKNKVSKFSLQTKVVIENNFLENDLKKKKDFKNKKKNEKKNNFKIENENDMVFSDLRGIKKNDVVNVFESKYVNKINQLENENIVLKKQNKFLEKEIEKKNEKNKLNFDNYQSELKDLKKKNFKIEKINIDLNKKFFEERIFFSEKEKNYEENLEILKIKLLNFKKKYFELNSIKEKDKKYTKKLIDSKKNEFLKDYKKQLKEKEENLQIIKKQYEQIQKVFKNKIDFFLKENKNLKEKLLKYQNYENLKSEGLKTENGFLKKKIEELNENLCLINNIKKNKRIIQSHKNLKKCKTKIKDNKNFHTKTLQKKRNK